MRLPGSAVSPRCSPLRTSREAGGYAVTPARGGRGLHPHGKLSYEVHPYLAIFLETRVPFRPTGRTSVPAQLSSVQLSLSRFAAGAYAGAARGAPGAPPASAAERPYQESCQALSQ